MPSTSARRHAYQTAVTRAAQWLVSHQQEDGGFGAVEALSHYSVLPATLLGVGQPQAAARLIPYLKKRFVCADGTFDMPEVAAGRQSAVEERCYTPSWTAYTTHLNAAFDISLPAMPHILEYQDPVSGGMFGTQEDCVRRKGILDAAVTCVAGQAAVATGYLAEARRMGDHIVNDIVANNPDLSKALYPVWDTERGLRTDPETPNRANMPAVLRWDGQNVHHYLTGMLISFLTDLYRAVGDRKYLDTALQVFGFAASCSPAMYESTLSHKLAWGCAWLYRVTGKAEHLEMGCRICDYLVGIQEPDGSFLHVSFIDSPANVNHSARMCTTQQFTLWIARVLAVL